MMKSSLNFPATLALLFLSVLTASHAAAPSSPASDDWATVFLLRFETPKVVIEGANAPNMYAESLVPNPQHPVVSLAPGPFGSAMECSLSKRLALHLRQVDHPVDAFSVDLWVYANPGAGDPEQVIYEFPGMHRLRAQPGDPGQLAWEVRVDGEWESLSAPLPAGIWTHVAGTFDGQVLRLFLDGKEVAQAKHPGLVRRLNLWNRTVAVGSDSDGKKRFAGRIDEFRLSKVARASFSDAVAKPPPSTQAALAPAPRIHQQDKDAQNRPVRLFSKLKIPRISKPPAVDGAFDDPAWSAIPAEWFLETGIGFDNMRNWEVAATVMYKIAYDSENLYVIARVLEAGTRGILPKGADFWQSNALELFLQPPGPKRPYIQIGLSPHGESWVAQFTPLDENPHHRETKAWKLPGLKTKSRISGDAWVLEAAIPFKDLGVPPPKAGDAWRGNLAYTARQPIQQNLSWAYVWPLFYWDYRFGNFEFGGTEPAKTGTKTLRGALVDEKGAPVNWGADRLAAFDVGGRPVRTNSLGEFTVTGLPEGPVTLRSLIPNYDPFLLTVDMKNPVEVLPPIVLTSSAIYASGLPAGETPVALYQASVELPPDLPARAADLKPLESLEYLATAGEFESRGLAILANKKIEAPRLVLDPVFTGPSGELKLDRAEPRWTQRLLVRDADNSTHEESSYVWRYLRLDSPDALFPGDLRHVVATIKLPEDARPGTYSGTLRLLSAEKELAAVPVSLTVPSFRLVKPEKQVGFYHYTKANGKPLTDEELRRDYRHMKELGASQVMLSDVNFQPAAKDPYAEIKRQIRLQKDAGMGPVYFVSPYPEPGSQLLSDKSADREKFEALVKGLDGVEKELGLAPGQIVLAFGDEIQRWRAHALRWIEWSKRLKAFSARKNYMTVSVPEIPEQQELYDKILPHLDIACYNGTPKQWDVIAADRKKHGLEAWFYPNSVHDTMYARIANGYYLWGSPFHAAVPWTFYYETKGEYFDSLKSDFTIYAYMAPDPAHPDAMIPALMGEAYREGYDDLRYLATLAEAIGKTPADQRAGEAFTSAQSLLARLSARPEMSRTHGAPSVYTPQELIGRRKEIVRAIDALAPSQPNQSQP
jgi:hypothetical protein